MQTDLIVFEEYFAATFEQVRDVIDKYITKLVEVIPEATIGFTCYLVDNKVLWKGVLAEQKSWGIDDVYYGYLEIMHVYMNSVSPIQIRLYCSKPQYLTYWSGLGKTLKNHLPRSDGSPIPSGELWNLVPDHGYDRDLLRLWHEGYRVKEIGERMHISASRLYARLDKLRKIHGIIIVPYRREDKRQQHNNQ
jgi:hypothetical protein